MNTSSLSASSVPLKQDAGVIALVGLAHTSSHFAHLLLPLLFPVFIQEFGLSYAELGLLMTVFFVVSGVGQTIAGFVVDRFGTGLVLFAAMGLFILACIVASLANSYGGLMLVAVIAGLGNSTFHPVDFTILNQRVSAPRLGHAFSVHNLTGNLGWALAPVFMVGMTSVVGWRNTYLAAALMYLAILCLLWLKRHRLRTEIVAQPAGFRLAHDTAFMKMPVVWLCFAFFVFSTITLSVVQNYSIPLLRALHGVSFELATATLTAYMLCSALGIFVGGFVATRNANNDVVVATCMGIGAVSWTLCGTGLLGATGTMMVLAATGFAIGIGGPSRDMMVRKSTPKGATGRVYGLVYSGFDVGSAIAPVLFGVLMDRGWYSTTFFGVALVLLLSVVTALNVGIRVGHVARPT